MNFRIPTKKQIAESRKIMREQYEVHYLLSIDSDPKTIKSNISGKGYYTAIQYLAPAKMSGRQTCASATAKCIEACLHSAGNPVFYKSKTKARIGRTRFFFEQREHYYNVLYAELKSFCDKCEAFGLKPAVRLNGTSDIVFENVAPWIFEVFGDIQFYDYSKHLKRFRSDWILPSNYALTLSRSDENEAEVLEVLANNPQARVAVVFATKRLGELPEAWQGHEVGDADKDDLRFLDQFPIAGLRAKGKAREDTSGFVVQV